MINFGDVSDIDIDNRGSEDSRDSDKNEEKKRKSDSNVSDIDKEANFSNDDCSEEIIQTNKLNIFNSNG